MKEIIEFICSLHGYLIRLKEIHWSTDSNAEHLLCDEISSELADLEDEFAETAMVLYGKKIGINDLKPLLPNAESLDKMLDELIGETIQMKSGPTKATFDGLNSILDDIIATGQKYKYRSTQK